MEVKYIEFSQPRPSKSGKTRIWNVLAFHDRFSVEDDYSIGEVKWRGSWRRYALFSARDTVFEQDCLRKIADFCENESKKLRKTWRKRRQSTGDHGNED